MKKANPGPEKRPQLPTMREMSNNRVDLWEKRLDENADDIPREVKPVVNKLDLNEMAKMVEKRWMWFSIRRSLTRRVKSDLDIQCCWAMNVGPARNGNFGETTDAHIVNF